MISNERIDHVAEARRIIHELGSINDPHGLAQVHATLALVEQQRIANLIALGMYTNADGSRLAQHAVAHPIEDYAVTINDDIREGLGL